MTPKAIAAIAALIEDLPGIVDNLTDAVADWQDEDLTPAERREQRDEAEDMIRASVGDLAVTVDAMRAAVNL
jgi:hypothetical protein